jgi:hypothetical protein
LKNRFLSFSVLLLSAVSFAAEKTEIIKIKGSLRYRHEMILEENNDSRNRHRIQAKAGIEGTVTPQTRVMVQISSGGPTARSANQSLDEAFTKKDLYINLAYFSWSPAFLPGLSLTGGKMENPFYRPCKSELIFDSDNVPEGITLQYKSGLTSVSPFVNIAGFWVDEEKEAEDTFLYAGQAGAKLPFADKKYYVLAGAGYYKYLDIRGHGVYDYAEGKFYNNSTDGDTVYANDYGSLEGFLEFGANLGGLPMAVFGHYIQNFDADFNNLGWLAGLSLGKARKPGSFSLRYYYRYLEKDAIFDVFADSDFGGGGTDNQGHEINVGVGIARNISGKVSYFINQKGLDNGTDYQRGQFDVKFKF